MGKDRVTSPKCQGRTVVVLALKDFLFEWKISICLILALAAVLTPLLVLFGLKTGIVTTMTDRLKSDPYTLEVKIVGNGHFKEEDITGLRNRSDVLFAIAKTRTLGATFVAFKRDMSAVSGIELVPTATDDPLLEGAVPPLDDQTVYVSHTLAKKLAVSAGDPLPVMVTRRLDGQQQAVRLTMKVQGVLSEAAYQRDAAFVTLAFLLAVEEYKDGFSVPAFGWEGNGARSNERDYAGIRLYAKGLEDVQVLADELRRQGLEVRTRAKEIETVRSIDRVLSRLFLIIASIGITGYALSLAASLWASVERKRKDLSLMRLLGYSAKAIVIFPIIQAALVAFLGAVLSIGLYKIIEYYLNTTLSESLVADELASRLTLETYGYTIILTLGLSLFSAFVGAVRATHIDPAESLREV
ncbi:ABC transporter permease [Terasakiella pusilla]|uniref:ABC transporter permease n=1 Tax=Terasakiella pusilla TaxID=64973 RepID=UPI003AA9BDAC